jgi:erythromycin esterase-like protein
MRSSSRRLLLVCGAISLTACRSAPPPPPPPPPLTDSAAAALRWVQSNVTPFQRADSIATPAERAFLVNLARNARIIGFSELTEGTREFPYIVRRATLALAESDQVRGLALQTPMAETMELDRYVRTGIGDAQRLLRNLGSWRWETREVRAMVEAIRAWNRGKPASQQVGLYGFEIPSAAHAVNVISAIPDSVVGAPLKSWLARQYSCVAINEGAHWGLEGRAADSLYWKSCGPATRVALDSVIALRRRVSATSRAAPEVAYAETMARLIEHHVRIGLQHLKRQDFNAEHVMFLLDLIGPNAQLVMWGGDVEMGRLILDKTTVQTAIPLSEKLGDRYRSVAFAFGDGTVRARPAGGSARGGGPPGLSDVAVRQPLPDTYEDVFNRVAHDGFWVDARSLPNDAAGAWLRGPRPMRLITELYAITAPELFQTPIELPKFFDAVVFARHATAAKQ